MPRRARPRKVPPKKSSILQDNQLPDTAILRLTLKRLCYRLADVIVRLEQEESIAAASDIAEPYLEPDLKEMLAAFSHIVRWADEIENRTHVSIKNAEGISTNGMRMNRANLKSLILYERFLELFQREKVLGETVNKQAIQRDRVEVYRAWCNEAMVLIQEHDLKKIEDFPIPIKKAPNEAAKELLSQFQSRNSPTLLHNAGSFIVRHNKEPIHGHSVKRISTDDIGDINNILSGLISLPQELVFKQVIMAIADCSEEEAEASIIPDPRNEDGSPGLS